MTVLSEQGSDARFCRSLLFAFITLLIATSFIVFFRLPSGVYRQRLKEVLKPIGVVGVLFGLLLPWDTGLGLLAAMLVAVILFVLCVYAVVVIEAPPSLVRRVWICRDVVREWFVYISIVAGLIGIVSTLLSIILPFWGITLGVEIPIAFDTISVSAALLEHMEKAPVKDYFKLVKRIDALEKELIAFIEENSRFEEIVLLKMRLNTLLALKTTMYGEEIG